MSIQMELETVELSLEMTVDVDVGADVGANVGVNANAGGNVGEAEGMAAGTAGTGAVAGAGRSTDTGTGTETGADTSPLGSRTSNCCHVAHQSCAGFNSVRDAQGNSRHRLMVLGGHHPILPGGAASRMAAGIPVATMVGPSSANRNPQLQNRPQQSHPQQPQQQQSQQNSSLPLGGSRLFSHSAMQLSWIAVPPSSTNRAGLSSSLSAVSMTATTAGSSVKRHFTHSSHPARRFDRDAHIHPSVSHDGLGARLLPISERSGDRHGGSSGWIRANDATVEVSYLAGAERGGSVMDVDQPAGDVNGNDDNKTMDAVWNNKDGLVAKISDNVAVQDVACGAEHAVLVTISGRLMVCLMVCGSNQRGQLGADVSRVPFATVIISVHHPSGGRFVSAEAGNAHSLLPDNIGDVRLTSLDDLQRVVKGHSVLAIAAGGDDSSVVVAPGSLNLDFKVAPTRTDFLRGVSLTSIICDSANLPTLHSSPTHLSSLSNGGNSASNARHNMTTRSTLKDSPSKTNVSSPATVVGNFQDLQSATALRSVQTEEDLLLIGKGADESSMHGFKNEHFSLSEHDSISSRFSDFKSDSNSNQNSNDSLSTVDAMDLHGVVEFDISDDDEVLDQLGSENYQLDSAYSQGFGDCRDEGSEGLTSGIQRCFSAAAGPSSNSDELDSPDSQGF